MRPAQKGAPRTSRRSQPRWFEYQGAHNGRELGQTLAFVLTEGQRHDNQVFEELMEGGEVKRSSSGRPRVRPGCIVADRSYSDERIHTWLRRKKVRAVIPRTSREMKRRGRRPLDRGSTRSATASSVS
jgi:Transposase DDE domain